MSPGHLRVVYFKTTAQPLLYHRAIGQLDAVGANILAQPLQGRPAIAGSAAEVGEQYPLGLLPHDNRRFFGNLTARLLSHYNKGFGRRLLAQLERHPPKKAISRWQTAQRRALRIVFWRRPEPTVFGFYIVAASIGGFLQIDGYKGFGHISPFFTSTALLEGEQFLLLT